MKPIECALTPAAVATAQRELEALVTSQEGVTLAVLTSSDGFEIAAHPRRQAGLTQKIAAMSSSLQALAEALVREVGVARNRSLIIESEGAAIVVLGTTCQALPASLSVVATGGPSLGQLLWASRNCCACLERNLKV